MILFFVLGYLVVGFIVFVGITMLLQIFVFGSVFRTVSRHVVQSLDAQMSAAEAAQRACTCEFCGAARVNAMDACAGCGAPPPGESRTRQTHPND